MDNGALDQKFAIEVLGVDQRTDPVCPPAHPFGGIATVGEPYFYLAIDHSEVGLRLKVRELQ